jgi:hypothetical protein
LLSGLLERIRDVGIWGLSHTRDGTSAAFLRLQVSGKGPLKLRRNIEQARRIDVVLLFQHELRLVLGVEHRRAMIEE